MSQDNGENWHIATVLSSYFFLFRDTFSSSLCRSGRREKKMTGRGLKGLTPPNWPQGEELVCLEKEGRKESGRELQMTGSLSAYY